MQFMLYIFVIKETIIDEGAKVAERASEADKSIGNRDRDICCLV